MRLPTIHTVTFSLVYGSIHVLPAIGNFASASMRNSRAAYASFSSRISLKRTVVVAGLLFVASLPCLSLSLTALSAFSAKMLIPGDLLGGIHPASMEMLVTSAVQSVTGMQ